MSENNNDVNQTIIIQKRTRGRPKLNLSDEEREERDRLKYEEHKEKQRLRYNKIPLDQQKKRGRPKVNVKLCEKCKCTI